MRAYKWAVWCCVVVGVCFVCGGGKARRALMRSTAVQQADCDIGVGENLELCSIYTHDAGGLVFEFARPVKTAFFWVLGEDARVDVWMFREDVGNLDKVVHPTAALAIDGVIYMGIGYDPGYVAVRIVGDVIVTVEDLVWADRP